MPIAFSVTEPFSGSGEMTGRASGFPVVYKRPSAVDPPERADIGVLTASAREMRAVAEMLGRCAGFATHDLPDGGVLYAAAIARARVVALQAIEPGERSAAVAYVTLRRRCSPAVIALVGTAGGVHDDVGLGDVVIGDRICGQAAPMSEFVLRRIDRFFAAHDSPLFMMSRSTGRTFKVMRGPVGSGEAHVGDRTLAVETATAGAARAFYERACSDRGVLGWLGIRGIADLVGLEGDELFHDAASRHAAETFERLVPYLMPDPATLPPDHEAR